MPVSESLGAACCAVITAAFFLERRSPRRFAVDALGVVTVFVAVAIAGSGARNGVALMVLGLFLWSFGLLIVRVMLQRSVSLWMLDQLAAGREDVEATDSMASRLDDARKVRLVARETGLCRLTRAGRLLAGLLRVLYGAAGIDR